jgi:endo-1,4-beta-mannosidase
MIHNEWKIGNCVVSEIDWKGKSHAFLIINNDGPQSEYILPRTIHEMNNYRKFIETMSSVSKGEVSYVS